MQKLIRTLLLALSLSPLAGFAAGPVDINTADAAAFEQIKGLGPAKAKAIVEYRKAKGPFASVDDLAKVPGIGAKSVAKMRSELTVGAPKKTAAAR